MTNRFSRDIMDLPTIRISRYHQAYQPAGPMDDPDPGQKFCVTSGIKKAEFEDAFPQRNHRTFSPINSGFLLRDRLEMAVGEGRDGDPGGGL